MTTINITRATIRERRAVTDQCTPVLTRGSRSDTSQLLPITIAGRTRYRPPCTLDDCTNPIRVLSAQLCRGTTTARSAGVTLASPRRAAGPTRPKDPSTLRTSRSSATAQRTTGSEVSRAQPMPGRDTGLVWSLGCQPLMDRPGSRPRRLRAYRQPAMTRSTTSPGRPPEGRGAAPCIALRGPVPIPLHQAAHPRPTAGPS